MQHRTNESIKLRKREMKSGSISLYLDIYKKGKRTYDYLNLYLHSKPSTHQERIHNKDTWRLAQSIHAQRLLDMQSTSNGFASSIKRDKKFIEFFEKLAAERKENKQEHSTWNATARAMRAYCSDDITFRELDEDFLKGLKDFLSTYQGAYDNGLSKNSKSTYFSKIRAAINEAFKSKHLSENPLTSVPAIRVVETERVYLTIEQVKKLAKTPFSHEVLRRAFLFSCLTGLRVSDASSLRWKQVKSFNEGTRIIFQQEKTEGQEYLDISDQAIQFLGDRGNPEEYVFPDLNKNRYHGPKLKQWCKAAGIDEDVTFHTARHTFAVMMLSLGVDIYTVSKLLGHKDIGTTQVYANIVDKVKQAAVQKIPDIGI